MDATRGEVAVLDVAREDGASTLTFTPRGRASRYEMALSFALAGVVNSARSSVADQLLVDIVGPIPFRLTERGRRAIEPSAHIAACPPSPAGDAAPPPQSRPVFNSRRTATVST